MQDLEKQVWDATKNAINDAVVRRLTDSYNSPLVKLVDQVVESRSAELKSLVDELFTGAIGDKEFRVHARQQMVHVVAKTLLSKMESSVDKAVNTFKSDPTTKAKVLLAIENIVKEHLGDRK